MHRMKTLAQNILLLVGLLSFNITTAQEVPVNIDDFITQHEGFEENESGEIIPINIKEINKKIRFCGANVSQCRVHTKHHLGFLRNLLKPV